MSLHSILLQTAALPAAIEARAAREFAVRRVRDLQNFGPDGDALLCSTANRIDAACIARLPPSVRAIGTFSVGYEHIDLAAAKARGIIVVNTPDVLSAATAEFSLLLMLGAARRAGEGERIVRAGKWGGWAPDAMLGTQVSGKNLGIFGMGRIGGELAKMAQGLRMQVRYHNRSRVAPDREAGAVFCPNEADFLAGCQFLALCAPGGAATRHWLDAARIAQLPPGAVVVNAARGSLIDDEALIAALKSGHVAAAGLDVFAAEPQVPAGYLALENVFLAPHLGSATLETRAAMGNLVLDGIAAVLAGRHPPNLVT